MRGFSLGEMLVSLLILSMMTVLLTGVIPASVMGLRTATQRATASYLARQTLEDVRSQDPFSLYTLGPVSAPNVTVDRDIFNIIYGVYDDTNLPKDPVFNTPTALSVQIVVAWKSKQGMQSQELRTLVNRP